MIRNKAKLDYMTTSCNRSVHLMSIFMNDDEYAIFQKVNGKHTGGISK